MNWKIENLYISKIFLYIIAMKQLSVTEAREQFPALLNQAAKMQVWISRWQTTKYMVHLIISHAAQQVS